MRLLLAFFAFVALGLAPLGLPAEARATDDHCAEMAGMDHHQQQPGPSDAAMVESCCTAMAADLPVMGAADRVVALRAPAVAMALSVQHGLRREVEVPRPRP